MKPKKNSTADVGKKGILFFQIGLLLVLFAAWQTLEMKTYAKEDVSQPFSVENDFLAETNVPIVVLPKPKVPVKAKIEPVPSVIDPTDFKVIDNISIEKPEPVLFTTPRKPLKPSDIQTVEPIDPIKDFPYIVVESVPVYPGCEGLSSNEEKKNCMEAKIRALVQKNFDTDIAEDLGLSGKNRIQILFKIDYQGNVGNVEVLTPHPRLKEEAFKIMQMLPKMKPGKQRGVPVNVSYSFPIILNVK